VEQIVDRLPSPGCQSNEETARGLDARSRHSGSPEEFCLPLFPVRGARELAVGLARQWQNWSEAETAVVALGFVRLGRKFLAQSRVDALPLIVEADFDRNQADTGFRQFATVDSDTSIRDAKPVLARAFPSTTDSVGGVLLYSPHQLDLPESACGEFARWSGRLLDQAGIVEEGLTGRRTLEAAKVEALGEFAAGAGHEINNPLATIAGRAQILLRNEIDGNRRQDLATIGAQALRAREMIGDLMLFARPPLPVPQRMLLNELAESVIDQFAAMAHSSSCRLELKVTGPVFGTVDPTQAKIVLSELVRNSLDSLGSNGERHDREIVIQLERFTASATTATVVSVTDNGPGFSEKDRAHLFDPFYSGRDSGRGLGFGLCKCWRIVNGHAGRIEVDSVPDVATTFRVFWPDDPAGPPYQLCETTFPCS
jgi:signal transduction histidine kinase